MRTADDSFMQENFYTNAFSDCLYNFSIAFPTPKLAVLCYGDQTLALQYISAERHGVILTVIDIDSATVVDAKFLERNRVLKVVMCSVFPGEHVNDIKQTKITVLSYYCHILHSEVDCDFKLLQRQEFLADVVDHVSLLSCTNFIHIFSRGGAEFIYDSMKPEYCWSQDGEWVTCWLKVPKTFVLNPPAIQISSTEICIQFAKLSYFEGKWQHEVDTDDVSLTRERGLLVMKLKKLDVEIEWSVLFKNRSGDRRRYVPGKVSVTDIETMVEKLSLGGKLDNSPTNASEGIARERVVRDKNLRYFERFCLTFNNATKIAPLGPGDIIILTNRQVMGSLMAIKQGIDVCIWNLKEISTGFTLQHDSTYPLLGEIISRNDNIKFFVSPPSFSYIALVENVRYISIYDKPPRRKKVGKMRKVDLGENSMPIVGASASEKYLNILTLDTLYKIIVPF